MWLPLPAWCRRDAIGGSWLITFSEALLLTTRSRDPLPESEQVASLVSISARRGELAVEVARYLRLSEIFEIGPQRDT